MPEDTKQTIKIVADLFVRFPNDDDGEIADKASAMGLNPIETELAVAFLPAAYARALIREQEQWSVELVDEFRTQDEKGRWSRFRLSENPTYQAAELLAEHDRVSHRPAFSAIAGRSAEIAVISSALKAGWSPSNPG